MLDFMKEFLQSGSALARLIGVLIRFLAFFSLAHHGHGLFKTIIIYLILTPVLWGVAPITLSESFWALLTQAVNSYLAYRIIEAGWLEEPTQAND